LGFSPKVKEEILSDTIRHCCVCHRYAGLNVEVHHIKPSASGGPDTYENAIAVCFDCHANAGHYNPKHPKGTKYSPSELKIAKDKWINIVKEHKISEPIEIKLIDIKNDGIAEFCDIKKEEVFNLYFEYKRMISIEYTNPEYDYYNKQIVVLGAAEEKIIWGDYLLKFPKVIQPYIIELRKRIEIEKLLDIKGPDINDILFEFIDGVTFRFTWRGWSSLVQSITYSQNGYLANYM